MKTQHEIELELTEATKRMVKVIQASKRQSALLSGEVSDPVPRPEVGLGSPPDLAAKLQR